MKTNAKVFAQKTVIASALLAMGAGSAFELSAAVLEEVIVTAQKREESIQDVPISISVVSGKAMDNFNVSAAEELEAYIPNFAVKDTPANNEIYVRGLGSPSGSLSLEQSVGLFVDGVYGGRARMFMAPFMDIERIEVLRGPQGAVVGKNTSAGAISIITAKPTEEAEFRISADYEFEYDSTTLQAIASGPLTDNFLGRLTVKAEDIGGYVKNTMLNRDEADRENLVVRATGVWLASADTTVTGKVEVADFDAEVFPIPRSTSVKPPTRPSTSDQTDGIVINDSDETKNGHHQPDRGNGPG